MSGDTPATENAVQTASAEETGSPKTPQEQLEVEDPEFSEEHINYPTGPKLWLTTSALTIALFLTGLDLTIVAVAVPSLTNQFNTISDIGWYSAAYGLTLSSFVFFFGKVYTIFSLKSVFILGFVIFEAGSLLCTFAPNSKAFVIGRAIAGIGSCAISTGKYKILRHCFPLAKLGLVGAVIGGFQSIGFVSAPFIGGVLTDAFNWRACFGINLPLGALCIAFTAYGFRDPIPNPHISLPFKEKLKRINIISTLLVVPAIICFLMALQWGGVKYGWKDPRIIVLFVLFVVLGSAFAYLQYRQGEDATLPPRILKNRSMLAGLSASKSGILGLPLMGGFAVAIIAGGLAINKIGYYSPFMIATSVLAPVASGLLTTLDLDESIAKAAGVLAFIGFAVGIGIQGPQLAVQAVLAPKDVTLGGAVMLFGGAMGSALWISASATLFQNRLVEEIAKHSPTTNVTALGDVGLSEIRDYIGSEKLLDVLSGYNEAVVQTLYMPLALGALTIIGSITMERRSIKKKQE